MTNGKYHLWTKLAIFCLLLFPLGTLRSMASPVMLDDQLEGLRTALIRRGFKVIFQHPSVQGAYGLYESKAKTLWISPLAFELGIGKQVFLHEAVHAVQSCPNGVLTPLGWHDNLPSSAEHEISGILYNNYRHKNKALEREAFLAQGQPNGAKRIIAALRTRCGKKRN